MANSLQVAGFLEHSNVNGEGFRSVLFLSGCPHNCYNCQNKEMQDPNYGEKVTYDEILARIEKVLPLIDGITLSGGEPFSQAEELIPFLRGLKERYQLNVWCYTGYMLEDLLTNPTYETMLQYIDVLVDGPYIEALRSPDKKFVGSSNQRILFRTH